MPAENSCYDKSHSHRPHNHSKHRQTSHYRPRTQIHYRPTNRPPKGKHHDTTFPANTPHSHRPKPPSTRPPKLHALTGVRYPDRPTQPPSSTTGPPTTHTSRSQSNSTQASSSSSSSTRPRGYPKPLGPGKGFPVLSARRYLRSQSSSFHIHPSSARRYRTYDIFDRHHHPCFNVIPTPLCLRETKTLYDLQRSDRRSSVIKSHQLMFSTRGRVSICDIRGNPLLYLQKVNIVNFPKIIHGFVGGRPSRKPHLIISEEKQDGRSYVIRDKKSNEVACIERYRLTSRHDRKRKYAYKLYISAGYDCSLFVMCAVLLLDMWNQ